MRVDSGLYAGLQVPLFYDPLLSKLIVWGKDRSQAIARMRRALHEYEIMGVRTTLPFDRWLMENPRFIKGELSTDFIAEEWEPLKRKHGAHHKYEAPELQEQSAATEEQPVPAQVAALVGALLMQEQVKEEKLRRGASHENGAETSRWRDAGRREALRRM